MPGQSRAPESHFAIAFRPHFFYFLRRLLCFFTERTNPKRRRVSARLVAHSTTPRSRRVPPVMVSQGGPSAGASGSGGASALLSPDTLGSAKKSKLSKRKRDDREEAEDLTGADSDDSDTSDVDTVAEAERMKRRAKRQRKEEKARKEAAKEPVVAQAPGWPVPTETDLYTGTAHKATIYEAGLVK